MPIALSIPCRVFLCCLLPGLAVAQAGSGYFAGNDVANTAVSIAGQSFLIDGLPTHPGRSWNGVSVEGLLFNSRMVNGAYDDMDGDPPSGMLPWDPLENTLDFVSEMPAWRMSGLDALTINFQGGSNRCHGLSGNDQSDDVDNNPFGPEGTRAFDDWDAGVDSPHGRYLARLGSIIRQADDIGLVVILGLFYFGQDEELLDEAAVLAATDAATDWILANGWTNVLVEIANEADLNYDHDIFDPDRVHELIQRVQVRSGGVAGVHLPHGRLLVSVSGPGRSLPPPAWIANADFVLLHGNGLNSRGVERLVDDVRDEPTWQADPKPIVYNEDSTSLGHFEAAVQRGASWGFYDDDGYQCVFGDDVEGRWSVAATSEPDYWPLLEEIGGPHVILSVPTATGAAQLLLGGLLLGAAGRRLARRTAPWRPPCR